MNSQIIESRMFFNIVAYYQQLMYFYGKYTSGDDEETIDLS